jgi:hypothetical protein
METDSLTHETEVVAKIMARENRKTISFWLMATTTALCVPIAASGWFMWLTKPRVEVKVERILVAEDGSPIKVFNYDEMPVEAKRRDVINSVVRYVTMREEFNELESGKNWDTVSRMSSKDVQEEYQKANRANSPTSQWQRYAPGGWVRTAFDSIIDETGVSGYKDIPPAYTVRFCRQEKIKDKTPGRPELWDATVGFKIVPGYDSRLISSYNPGSIQVTSYRESRPVGVLSNQPGNGLKGCVGL